MLGHSSLFNRMDKLFITALLPSLSWLLLLYDSSSSILSRGASAMATRALPQALVSIPTYNLPKHQALSTLVSSRSSQFINGGGLSLSRASSGSYRSPIDASIFSRSFVVRAEAQPEVELVPEENEESEAEAVALAVAEEVAKPPRKLRANLGDIMGLLNKRAVEASEQERPVPDIRTGDVVEIKLEVPENRRRLSMYKGIVISRQNAGIHTTIRIRRIIAGVGVEIVFPLYSPSIKEIKVLKHRKVRRARLYYLRDKLPRLSTFK